MPSIAAHPLFSLLAKLPDNPGVYLFYNDKKELLYVGKAASLRSRVRSYFQGQRHPRPIEELIHEVADIDWEETDSALEAIILEANYIHKFQPAYNVLGKDNKSWNYIVITKDDYPRVETLRQHELDKLRREDPKTVRRWKHVFGPYPGLNTKAAMRLLRKLFRFSNCEPGNGRPCLYYQMGQCPGVCIGAITAEEYRRQAIRPLATLLSGRKKQVVAMFEREMRRAVKGERFEQAARLRDQLQSLYRIQDMALLNKSFTEDEPASTAIRIEGYDISNLGATEKVASMVVFNAVGPVKSQYRKFIIRTVEGQSDVDCLEEVMTRRFKRLSGPASWSLPTALLIDGGRPQVNRVRQIVTGHDNPAVRALPVVGIAKGPERKRNDFIITNVADKKKEWFAWVSAHRELLIQVRDEAHRFAVTFHRQRRDRRVVIN